MTIATTILEQLGGNRFTAMTGANKMIAHAAGLQFNIPRSTNGANRVVITLTPADLYEVRFYSIRGLKFREVALLEGVYADRLRAAFTAATGLETSL